MKPSIFKIPAIILAASFFGLAGTASATPTVMQWHDIDAGRPLDFLYESYPNDGKSGGDTSYTGWFNLGSSFDSSLFEICEIKVGFAFADDGDDWREYVDIKVGDQKLWNDHEVNGSHSEYQWHWKDVSTNSSILADLSADGKIKYRVSINDLINDYSNKQWKREDVYLKVAEIWVTGKKRNVPESGATVALMGLSLLGLAAGRRFLKKG